MLNPGPRGPGTSGPGRNSRLSRPLWASPRPKLNAQSCRGKVIARSTHGPAACAGSSADKSSSTKAEAPRMLADDLISHVGLSQLCPSHLGRRHGLLPREAHREKNDMVIFRLGGAP